MLLRWASPTDAQALISTGIAAGQYCPMNFSLAKRMRRVIRRKLSYNHSSQAGQIRSHFTAIAPPGAKLLISGSHNEC
jgi:hypothetical protein